MIDIYVEYGTGQRHAVCEQHSLLLVAPCWWAGPTAGACEACEDVEALAEEVSRTERLPFGKARAAAQEQLGMLHGYAQEWDQLAHRCPTCGSQVQAA